VAALEYRGPRAEGVVAVELWNSNRQRELAVGPSARDVSAITPEDLFGKDERGSARIGSLRSLNGSVLYPVIAPVEDGDRRAGSVVQWRILSLTLGLTGLQLYLGNKDGGLWTDLKAIAPGPPVDVALLPGVIRYERPGAGTIIASATAVPGTSWLLLLEVSQRALFAPVYRFLIRLAVVSLFLFAVGLTIAWLVSRRITRPLGQLTETAEAIASGDYSHEVRINREDELGRLALAFDSMRQALVAAMRRSEERLARVLDTAHEAFVGMDAAGHIVDWNPLAEKTLGWSREEVLGRSLADTIIPERYREPHRRGLARFLESGEGPALNRRFEMTALHRDGHEFPIELVIWPRRWRDGYLFNALLHDISDRKRAEQSLAQKSGELEAANRELEAFSYSVSHDLRAPLRSIDGFSRVLQEDFEGKLGADGEDALRRIRTAAQRMGLLIDDLLKLARVSRAELRRVSVDLSEMARGLMSEFQTDPWSV
jgi:PAS domain S-box-containing protein